MRLVPLRTALDNEDMGATKKILEEMASTERNFKLAKGETTAEPQKSQFDLNAAKELLTTVGGLTGKK